MIKIETIAYMAINTPLYKLCSLLSHPNPFSVLVSPKRHGHSGNAGGRHKDEHNIAALARSYSTEAIETLVELMRNARDDRVRGTAAQALLDRGFGKPKVEI